MDRREITAAVVEEADRLLAEGVDHATIAARLRITEYVVGVLADNRQRNRRRQPRDLFARHVRHRQNAVDASVVRMVQRMLLVGILNHRQIALEAGVSPNFVTQIASGRRAAVSTLQPILSKGERFVPEPIRCGGCGRRIVVTPCRICRALRRKHSEKISSRV